MYFKKKKSLLSVMISAAMVTTLSGCFNDDDDDNNGSNSSVDNAPVSLFVVSDLGSNNGRISKYLFDEDTGLGTVQQSIDLGIAEGVANDSAGNLYQAGNNTGGDGVIQASCSPHTNASRTITSALSSPKGIAIARDTGHIIATESGAPTDAISVFSSTAADATAPLFSVSRAELGGTGAWDVVYDQDSDKLFTALTNGTVSYHEGFMAGLALGNTAPTAIFKPDNPLASSNMHGIVYVAEDDRLIVSDVADPTSATDGSIYVFEMASTLSGTVTADRTIRGAASNLGNPVDLQLNGNDLFVAEKANEGGRILVYKDIANGASGDIAANSNFLVPGIESIISQSVLQDATSDISDLSDETITQLHATGNAGGAGQQVSIVDLALSSVGRSFTPVVGGQFVESVSLDKNGDAIIGFDEGDTTASGLSFVNRLSSRLDGTAYSAMRDRQITGAQTTLASPKGIEVVSGKGLVLVADLNAAAPGAIKAYSLCGTGNAAPVFTTTLPGTTRPWDVDYDPDGDRLYVAATDGTIQVYDNYIADMPTSPSRTIDPDDQSGFAASNIHGIVHDAATDRLIVSDVGSAAVADDGRIYVIDNASTADGVTALKLELAGANTALGNPVDLAFDGSNLFVAEKSNNQLQRIDNIYSLSGLQNVAPTKSLPFAGAESIALAPDYLPW